MILTNKHILILGGLGLLGKAVAQSAHEQGAKLIVADLDIDGLKQHFENWQNVEIRQLDVTNEQQVIAFFDSIEVLDGAVNCTYPRNQQYGAHFFDVSLASFNENVSLHLGSAFLISQQCAKLFNRLQQPFSLVNISSIYGVNAPDFSIYENTPMTMPVEYAAIKSALLHLNKYIVKYVKDSRFRINAISPGGIFDHQPTDFLKAYQAKTHGQGMLSINDFVGTINYLLSEQAKFVTGQNIIIDDGFTL
ncbi:SDR family oxidoreductase [Thalassotalea sp. LPB0316]|uniref:oxidoreductase n=1 Tax=Thalassotalea sp. LPB0316 TaxID=2769490 RepID=UPI0018690DB5|nr:oxidoreductase [Thalassotalea sp. LPB0316]QOL27086.1 SDR family oxidoreductase [Thalassotalea sp. LPB0316]